MSALSTASSAPTSRSLGTVAGLVVPQWPVVYEGGVDGRPSVVLQALGALAKTFDPAQVDTIITLSPFWIARTQFYIEPSPHHSAKNDFWGYPYDLRYECPGNPELARLLLEEGRRAGLPVDFCPYWTDVATSVPLKVLAPKGNIPVLPLSSSELSLDTCLAWGQAIRQAIEKSGKRVLILSGGGLSHNLTACLHLEDGMAAVIFDQKVLTCLKEGNGAQADKMDPYWIQVGNPAAGLSDLYVFLGAIGPHTRFTLHAHDGAPGQSWAVLSH